MSVSRRYHKFFCALAVRCSGEFLFTAQIRKPAGELLRAFNASRSIESRECRSRRRDPERKPTKALVGFLIAVHPGLDIARVRRAPPPVALRNNYSVHDVI
jgi:hypothetical protein